MYILKKISTYFFMFLFIRKKDYAKFSANDKNANAN